MITSTSNQQIKNIIQLTKKSKARKEQRLFVVEGIRMAVEAPIEQIEKIYVADSSKDKFLPRLEEAGLTREAGVFIELVDDKVMKAISDTVTPQGVLCVLKQKQYNLEDLLKTEENPFFMILEDLQDPGNLGTIMRTGEGAGVTGVILSRTSVDIYNPKTIRSTMGSIYRVPFLYVDSIQDILPQLAKAGVRTYAAHLRGEHDYDQEDYQGGTAFFIGNEGNGLTDELSEQADCLIKIPMKGQLESLNAAMAAGILMYEAARQRK